MFVGKMFNVTAFLLLVLFIGCSNDKVEENISANSGLNERNKNNTYDFLSKKTSFSMKDKWGTTSEYLLSSKNDMCTLSYTLIVYPHDYYGNAQYTDEMTVDLKDIDPTEIEVQSDYNTVSFKIRDKKELVKIKRWYSSYHIKKHPNDNKVDRFNSSWYTFSAKDLRDATKAAKALTHLVKLCGGKGELF